jgi:dihydroorotate dehydrogenase (fumarate)
MASRVPTRSVEFAAQLTAISGLTRRFRRDERCRRAQRSGNVHPRAKNSAITADAPGLTSDAMQQCRISGSRMDFEGRVCETAAAGVPFRDGMRCAVANQKPSIHQSEGYSMSTIDLSTTYLGLRLSNPFIVGASPLGDSLDTIRRLEDAGCAAVVLHSLFEEQISQQSTGRIHHMDPLDQRFETVVSYFPAPNSYAFGPHEYVEHIRKAKAAVSIPIIGSINGTTAEAWLKFAKLIEQAGADALEANMYEVVTDFNQSAAAVELGLRQIVTDLKRELAIPVSMKLSPFFTALGHVARDLDEAGVDGLVLFNRFLQPDIDVRHMAVWPRLELSDRNELLLRLRWLAILRGSVRCSLAATGGVATPTDGIKALLAGADVVQMVSAILRHGPAYFSLMCDELRHWMESLNLTVLTEIRGRLSLANTEAPGAFERAQYIKTLNSWSSWLGYQAYVRLHENEPEVPS